MNDQIWFVKVDWKECSLHKRIVDQMIITYEACWHWDQGFVLEDWEPEDLQSNVGSLQPGDCHLLFDHRHIEDWDCWNHMVEPVIIIMFFKKFV